MSDRYQGYQRLKFDYPQDRILRITISRPERYNALDAVGHRELTYVWREVDEDPDIVVSGINYGANLGDDVIYSGTVAAAMEGRFLGLPAIALSLVSDESPRHFDAAAEAASRLVRQLFRDPLPADTIRVPVPILPCSRSLWTRITWPTKFS